MAAAKIAAITIAMLVCLTPARAEFTAQQYLDYYDKRTRQTSDHLQLIIEATKNGLMWANARLRNEKLPPLFCPPGKIALQSDQLTDILRRYVKTEPAAAGQPLGMTLMQALTDVFPCSKESR